MKSKEFPPLQMQVPHEQSTGRSRRKSGVPKKLVVLVNPDNGEESEDLYDSDKDKRYETESDEDEEDDDEEGKTDDEDKEMPPAEPPTESDDDEEWAPTEEPHHQVNLISIL